MLHPFALWLEISHSVSRYKHLEPDTRLNRRENSGDRNMGSAVFLEWVNKYPNCKTRWLKRYNLKWIRKIHSVFTVLPNLYIRYRTYLDQTIITSITGKTQLNLPLDQYKKTKHLKTSGAFEECCRANYVKHIHWFKIRVW